MSGMECLSRPATVSWYFFLLLAFLCALLLGQQNWIDCMLQGALRETQASGINLLSLLGWSELRELRFIAFPCVQAKTWFHIWFHHATSIFNPFDIFWHFFTQVDGLDFPMVVFSSFFIFDFSWTFRPGGAGLGFPTHSWHWLLTPQKSYGLRRNAVIILRLSWKGQYDQYGLGFRMFQALLQSSFWSSFWSCSLPMISQRYRIACIAILAILY